MVAEHALTYRALAVSKSYQRCRRKQSRFSTLAAANCGSLAGTAPRCWSGCKGRTALAGTVSCSSPSLISDYFTERDNAAFTCEEGYRAFRCLIEADLGSTHELSFRGHPLQDTFVDKFTEMMREKTTTKPHIGDALIPDFPVGCKRITPGPGYLESLCCDNVSRKGYS